MRHLVVPVLLIASLVPAFPLQNADAQLQRSIDFPYDAAALQQAIDAGGPVALPWFVGELQVELEPVDLFADDFSALGPAGETLEVKAKPYAGHVRGQPDSHVRLTLTDEWAVALIIQADGSYVWLEPVPGLAPMHRLSDGVAFEHNVLDLDRDPVPPTLADDGGRRLLQSHNCPLGIRQLYNTPVCQRHNESPFTPQAPTGSSTVIVDASHEYCTSASDPDGDSLSYAFDWGDESGTTNSPWVASGQQGCASHAWASVGSFCVKAYAEDGVAPPSGWGGCKTVMVQAAVGNDAPAVPAAPTGPTSRTPNVSGQYCASSTDPNGDNVRIRFDWGDSSQSESAWVASGAQTCFNKSWPSTGSYCVQAQSRDGGHGYGSFGDCLTVTVSSGNQAPATPGTPSGPTTRTPNQSGQYCASSSDPESDNVMIRFDWGDTTQDESGWVSSGSQACLNKAWAAGSYCVKAQSKDAGHAYGSWSGCLTVTVAQGNQGPGTPDTPTGPSARTPGQSGQYCTSSSDPDGDNVMIRFDWNDGSQSESGWVTSGSQTCLNKSWTSAGTYCVKAQSKDSGHAYGSFSACLTVTVASGNTGPGTPGTPTGSSPVTVNTQNQYCTSATDPDGDDVQYGFDWGDNSGTTLSAWVDSGQQGCASHGWSSTGTYCVKAYSHDGINPASGWSQCKNVSVQTAPNSAPGTPATPTGPTARVTHEMGQYCTSSSDPESESVMIRFDWGDSEQSETDWVASGSQACLGNSWPTAASYCVKAQSKDAGHAYGAWSGCLTVAVTNPNEAPSTPDTPSGPTSRNPGVVGEYCTRSTDPESDSVNLRFDWGDTTQSETGWVTSGSLRCINKSWSATGTYCVKAQSKDATHAYGSFSGCLTVTVASNQAPGTPGTPTGPISRTPNQVGSYCASSSDPDIDNVMIRFDWGDSTQSESAWVTSGSQTCLNKSWPTGSYCVKAQSKDATHAYGSFSNCLTVTVATVNSAPTATAPWGPAYAHSGRSVPFASHVSDPNGDAVRFVFQWADGTTTNSEWVYEVAGGPATATHAYSVTSSSWFTYCGYAEDAYGAKSATTCTATAIEVLPTRVKAEYHAIADVSTWNAYGAGWTDMVTGYVNNMNGMFGQSSPDIELVITGFDTTSWDDPAGSDCGDNLEHLANFERYTNQYAELVQGWVDHTFQEGTLGCAWSGNYADGEDYFSVVSISASNSWPSGVSEVAGHEIGHMFGGDHSDATTWYSWPHIHCSIMWSADPNDPSPGNCWHTHLEANGVEKASFRAGATANQGRDVQPHLPIVTVMSNVGQLSLRVQTFDPDKDRIYYRIYWGDGAETNSAWVANGVSQTLSHTYASSGAKTVSVYTYDAHLYSRGEQQTYQFWL